MSTDSEIIAEIDRAFAGVEAPEHFYANHNHCDECAEHDELLRTHDRYALTMDEIGHMSWDPVTGASPHGWAYLVPALARLVFSTEEHPIGWYGEQFIFHLERDGKRNERWLYCTPQQRAAIAAMLEHIIETRAEMLETYMSDHQAFRVLEIWRDFGD
jgi:hypothetical protein